MSSSREDPTGQEVDLTTLSVQQLQELRRQLESELEHLSGSFGQLRGARGKYQAAVKALGQSFPKAVAGGNKGDDTAVPAKKELLVPLTSSLYVPATSSHKKNPSVLVDVGTGYHIRMTPEKATEYYNGKVVGLDVNLQELERVVNLKAGDVQAVSEVMTEKIRASQAASA
ncbi:subunit of tubulin prefoldin [Savitreella phatthalungensis]